MKAFRVLVINPGPTSIEVAVFDMEPLSDAALRVLSGEEEARHVGG